MVCLLFSLFFLPFLLLRVLIKTAVALVMLPIALLVAGIGMLVCFVVFSVAIAIPLMPIAILVGSIWLIVRLTSRPAAI
jgi:hypothetical protein